MGQIVECVHLYVGDGGFYGSYHVCPQSSDCGLAAVLGDIQEDYMARPAVKRLYFCAAVKYPKECRQARPDFERRMKKAIPDRRSHA